MDRKRIWIRFGELFLKGKNKKYFIQKLKQLLQNKIQDLHSINLQVKHDYAYLDYYYSLEKEVLKRLSYISGISSFVVVVKANKDFDDIIQKACLLLKEKIIKPTFFKIETTRKDKSFFLKSLEITKKIAPHILNHFKGLLIVNVKKPQAILNISVRRNNVYLYLKHDQKEALGGLPVSSSGKGLLLLSGGIDSPVAGYLAMKKGIMIDLFHFDSSPLTPLESIQKVIDLSKVLSRYAPDDQIKLHLVPFKSLQEIIKRKVSNAYIISIMRRMMYRLAERFAQKNNHLCLINGESVGQVASQTLESIKTISEVSRMTILRPLITMDKNEIIKIAKNIGTFDISIRAFQDCCTFYLPSNLSTKPTIAKAKREEYFFDYNSLLFEALAKTITLNIHKDMKFNIVDFGCWDVCEAISNFCQQKPEQKIITKYL